MCSNDNLIELKCTILEKNIRIKIRKAGALNPSNHFATMISIIVIVKDNKLRSKHTENLSRILTHMHVVVGMLRKKLNLHLKAKIITKQEQNSVQSFSDSDLNHCHCQIY